MSLECKTKEFLLLPSSAKSVYTDSICVNHTKSLQLSFLSDHLDYFSILIHLPPQGVLFFCFCFFLLQASNLDTNYSSMLGFSFCHRDDKQDGSWVESEASQTEITQRIPLSSLKLTQSTYKTDKPFFLIIFLTSLTKSWHMLLLKGFLPLYKDQTNIIFKSQFSMTHGLRKESGYVRCTLSQQSDRE